MKNNDQIIEYLCEMLDNRHMSMSELARRVGMSKSTISRYFNKKQGFPLNKVDKFASALGTTPEEVLGVEPIDLVPVSRLRKIPVLGMIACGEPILAEENIDSYISQPVNNLPKGRLFYLKAKGNSMKPTIPDGSLVLIRQQPEVESGEIAAVLFTDSTEATIDWKKIITPKTIIIIPKTNFVVFIKPSEIAAFNVDQFLDVNM